MQSSTMTCITTPRPTTRPTTRRSGITLLFVVSMIVLFLLMGTTFVVVSHDYLTDAKRRGRVDLKPLRAEVSMQNILFEFVRGPSLLNVNSPLRGHSLLADQYGYGFSAYIDSAIIAPGTDGQIFEIQLRGTPDNASDANDEFISPLLYNPSTDVRPALIDLATLTGGGPSTPGLPNGVSGFFNGQILSVVSGVASGISTRIIDHYVNGTDHVFWVIPEWYDSSGSITDLANSRVIINGRPFSGYGAGYDPTNAVPIRMQGLLANQRAYYSGPDQFFNTYAKVNSGTNDYSGSVSVNEDYDTFDHNNMFLSTPLAPTFAFNTNQAETHGDIVDDSIASFHRPELWRAGTAIRNAGGAAIENQYSFRPVFVDRVNNTTLAIGGDGFHDELDVDGNPVEAIPTIGGQFPGYYDHDNDPNTDPIFDMFRPLDVDNNGDGVADSIWMDIGLPPRMMDSGRRVKPLVAPLIVDLDGRLNANAHGTLVDADSSQNQLMTRFPMLGSPAEFPKGLGMGPAEVSLGALAGSGGNWNYLHFLQGNTDFAGRYGADNLPGIAGRDAWSRVKFVGYPDITANTSNNGFVGGLYTSHPLDMSGRYGYGVPDLQDPTYSVPLGVSSADIESHFAGGVGVYAGEAVDSPYEVDLLSTTFNSNDNLFTARELERALRFGDADAPQLPGRLASFLNLDSNPDRANLVTTHSFEVARAPMVPAGTVGFAGNQTVAERLYSLIEANSSLTEDQIRIQVEALLAPEVRRGLAMNLNRLFGDGQDNDNDGVFDEHYPDDPNTTADDDLNEARDDTLVDVEGSNIAIDHNNNGMVHVNDNFDFMARQIFARHLYVLFWMVAGDGVAPPDMNNDGNRNIDDVDALAQWCVNVVDFRDADVICTAFEYDRNPFDGWDADGDIDNGGAPDPNIGVVWGAERPELLLNEAIATHDRKTEDLTVANTTTSTRSPDNDFDSDALPVASCFVELFAPQYNTNNANNNSQKYPAELYQNNAINLAQRVQHATLNNSDVVPVWRLLFTEERGDTANDSDARRVYFIRPSDTVAFGDPVEDGTDENFYFPDSNISPVNAQHLVYPNGYAVIGSGGVEYTINGEEFYRTSFGRRTDAFIDHTSGTHADTDLNIEDTRQFRFVRDTNDFNNNRIEILHGDATTEVERFCTVIPINRSGHVSYMFPMDSGDAIRSFGLSDPNNGYYAAFPTRVIGEMAPSMGGPTGSGGPAAGDGLYFESGIVDEPCDVTTYHDHLVLDDALHESYRYVALQRLANPQAPYHIIYNPYVTVDEEPVDLTVFNGTESYNGYEPSLDPTANPQLALDDVDTKFRTLERGLTDHNDGGSGSPVEQRRTLWKPDWTSEEPATDEPGTRVVDHIFDFQWFESLGEINEIDRDPAFSDTAWPSLAWNNRPFVSQYELASVPGGSGQKFINEFTDPGDMRADMDTPISTMQMLQKFTLPGATFDPATSSNHLLKFQDVGNNTLARIFDFVEVPSRYVGTEFTFNPTVFTGDDGTVNTTGPRFNAPYNVVSRYRSPGKINLNTIVSQEVWNAFIGDYATVGTTPLDANLLESTRRDAGNLSFFTKPFRSPGMGQFVPLDPTGNPLDDGNGTLLLPYENEETAYARGFRYANDAAFNDTRRNQQFGDRPLNRFANIGTNRSSVFAIWLTVSWFEVDEFGLLGAEVVDDVTGQPDRKRAFFVYDRSVPVAFEPGQNHNIERGILTQTILD